MGAWAEDAFGNDTACDWAGEFSDSPSMEKIEAIIEAVISEDDDIDSDIACEALVACEVVARLKGEWGQRSAYSESIDQWVETCDAGLTLRCRRSVALYAQHRVSRNAR